MIQKILFVMIESVHESAIKVLKRHQVTPWTILSFESCCFIQAIQLQLSLNQGMNEMQGLVSLTDPGTPVAGISGCPVFYTSILETPVDSNFCLYPSGGKFLLEFKFHYFANGQCKFRLFLFL